MFKSQPNIKDSEALMMGTTSSKSLTPVIKLQNYSYHRTKISGLPITPTTKGIMFFAYVHVTGIIKTLNTVHYESTGESLYDVDRIDNEERVIHFHVPPSEIPQEYEVVNMIEEGDWSYSLTEQEYLQLTDPQITNEQDFILFSPIKENDTNNRNRIN